MPLVGKKSWRINLLDFSLLRSPNVCHHEHKAKQLRFEPEVELGFAVADGSEVCAVSTHGSDISRRRAHGLWMDSQHEDRLLKEFLRGYEEA